MIEAKLKSVEKKPNGPIDRLIVTAEFMEGETLLKQKEYDIVVTEYPDENAVWQLVEADTRILERSKSLTEGMEAFKGQKIPRVEIPEKEDVTPKQDDPGAK